MVAVAAEARVIRVPSRAAADIAGAVKIAAPGDTIEVGPGRWCGASITTENLTLKGEGRAMIVGGTPRGSCPTVTVLGASRHVGFALGAAANGTTIRHFVFVGGSGDGLGIGVYGTGARGVVVEHNRFEGGHQHAVRNEGGSGWQIRHNKVSGLSEGLGIGGSAILVTHGGVASPEGTVVAHNRVEADVPAGFAGDWFSAVRLEGAKGSEVERNKFELAGGGKGAGVVVTGYRPTRTTPPPPPRPPMPGPMAGPGLPPPPPPAPAPAPVAIPSVDSTVTMNEGRKSDFVVVLGAADMQNGTVLARNKGATRDADGQVAYFGDRRNDGDGDERHARSDD
jgi:hypothetical protein